MKDAVRRLNNVDGLAIKKGGRIVILKLNDITWIEAKGKYTCFHTARGNHAVREGISSVHAELQPAQFIRIHRSTIINGDQIREIHTSERGEYFVILNDGTSLQCSRSYKKRLDQVVNESPDFTNNS